MSVPGWVSEGVSGCPGTGEGVSGCPGTGEGVSGCPGTGEGVSGSWWSYSSNSRERYRGEKSTGEQGENGETINYLLTLL